MAEHNVDFYVFRCEPGEFFQILGRYAFHLVIPAPIKRPVLAISPRALLTRYAKYFNAIEPQRSSKHSLGTVNLLNGQPLQSPLRKCCGARRGEGN
jgi:hypothetical protein